MARVEVYTTPYCGYCRQAKRLLAERGIPFEEIDLGEDDDLRAQIIERSGQRTVPQIFIDGRPIGGYEELAALDCAGRLDPILARG
jgi:glutaredoxin 3